MINLRSCLAFSGIGLFLYFLVQSATEVGETHPHSGAFVSLSVDVDQKAATNMVLRLRLRNTGTNDMLIPLGELPWDRYAMTMVLVKGNDPFSVPLKQETGIADPPPGPPHRVKSGQTLEGRINLNHRFPDLEDHLRRGEVLFFWSYKCPAKDSSIDRIGGWFVLPRAEP